MWLGHNGQAGNRAVISPHNQETGSRVHTMSGQASAIYSSSIAATDALIKYSPA
jgi:hypothetical protein